jgi:hypothetical protein
VITNKESIVWRYRSFRKDREWHLKLRGLEVNRISGRFCGYLTSGRSPFPNCSVIDSTCALAPSYRLEIVMAAIPRPADLREIPVISCSRLTANLLGCHVTDTAERARIRALTFQCRNPRGRQCADDAGESAIDCNRPSAVAAIDLNQSGGDDRSQS